MLQRHESPQTVQKLHSGFPHGCGFSMIGHGLHLRTFPEPDAAASGVGR